MMYMYLLLTYSLTKKGCMSGNGCGGSGFSNVWVAVAVPEPWTKVIC